MRQAFRRGSNLAVETRRPHGPHNPRFPYARARKETLERVARGVMCHGWKNRGTLRSRLSVAQKRPKLEGLPATCRVLPGSDRPTPNE